MSKDFRLTWECSHRTFEEVVALGDDRMSLRGSQPIASTSVTRVWVNSEILIPQGGLYSTGQLYSTDSGPFDVTSGADTLEITTSEDSATVSFGVTTTARITTDQVVTAIRATNPTTLYAENINGHLVLTDAATAGPESVVKVKGTGATSFGFGNTGDACGLVDPRQMSARGKKLYPGWRIVRYAETDQDILDQLADLDPELLPSFGTRWFQFVEPIRSNPVFKLSYAAAQSRCLRCQQSGLENDFRYDTSGQGIFLENENLLQQGALKLILTDRGSNAFHPWYGTKIRSRIGMKALSSVASLINEDVRRSLSRFQALQAEQGKYQQVTAKERLYSVLSVQTYTLVDDPTMFVVDTVVQNASSEPVSLTSLFTVSDVVAFLQQSGQVVSATPNAPVRGL